MAERVTWKRAIDVTASTLGILVASPVVAAVALGEMIEHRSTNIIFQQKRLGRDGKPFRVLKFKTIKNVRDADNKMLPEEHPERKPPFLRMLRKTGLDELPQLFNILKGDMSLVGPRPYPTSLMSPGDYKRSRIIQERQSVRPGLFCPNHAIADLRLRDTWLEQLDNDIGYVRNHVVFNDFMIITKALVTKMQNGHPEAGLPVPFKQFCENSSEIKAWEEKIIQSQTVKPSQNVPVLA